MSRKLYLHIGAHKTATTTIQRAFWEGRRKLARAGVLYPKAAHYHFAQHRLAFGLKDRPDPDTGEVPDFDTEMAALRAEVLAARQQVAFVSSEAFSVTRRPLIRRLVEAVDFAELHVIAVVRRQDDFLLSLYNQNAKGLGNGFTRTLEEVVADPRSISREISFLDWVTKWSATVGRNRMRLCRYEDGAPVAMMLEMLGLPPDTLRPPSQHANTSLPAAAVEAIRQAKADGLPVEAQRQVADRARRRFAGGPRAELSPQARRRILEVFAEENATLFARFGMDNSYAPGAAEQAPP